MKQYAPVALFVYNRLGHVQKTVDALRKNHLAGESELYVFSDGPKDKEAQEGVSMVRKYIKTITGFLKVTIIERDRNFGLSGSIIKGVGELIAQHGRAIVLEDDLITSPYFLKFMNDGLLVYNDEEKVISICGYMYPISKDHKGTLFLRIADCWGWATWKRGWDLFMADGKELYNELKARKLLRAFDPGGAFNYTRMLKAQIRGRNDSWAIRWHASSILNDKLSLYAGRSLIRNIGFDGSGAHGGTVDYYKTKLLTEQVTVAKIPVIEDNRAVEEIRSFMIKQRFFNIAVKAIGFFRKRAYNNKSTGVRTYEC